jgi:hypothetical protein
MPALIAIVGCGMVVAVVVLLARRSRFVWVIEVHDGEVQIKSGEPPREFVDDVERICQDGDITEAVISGVREGRYTSLSFSRNVPKMQHQRFRNAWSFHT